MVSGNQIIYPKQNDNFKVNERMVRNQTLQRTSTLELIMVFMLTLIVSMSIFLLFDILTIREQLNLSGELERVQFWDMSDFNYDTRVKLNDKPNPLDSTTSSSFLPSTKRKPAPRRNFLSGGFKSTQPVDTKTLTRPDFNSPISTNVTRKSSFWIFTLHTSPKVYQDSKFKGKDSDLYNTGVTSLIPFGYNRFDPLDMNSYFSSIIISIKPINDSKSLPSGSTVIHPINSTKLLERNYKKSKK